MTPRDDSRRDEARRRATPPRGLDAERWPAEILADDRGRLPLPMNGQASSARPDWEEAAASALEQEKRRRDDELPLESLAIPETIRSRLLRQAWAEAGEAGGPRRAPRAKWLVPAAACLLASLAMLLPRGDSPWPAPAAKPADSTLLIQDGVGTENSPDAFADHSPFDGSLLDRVGLPPRKDADVSFTRLVVFDQMTLEPRVLLSDRFRMAIGVDLTAIESDGG